MESSLPDLVRDTKLETIRAADHVVHIIYVSNVSIGQRRARVEERWETGKFLGRGSFGCVLLQKCTSGPNSGQVRAVKEIYKGTPSSFQATTCYTRELEAIAKFSQERYRCHRTVTKTTRY
ncbi:hypothetical protein B0T19DRAFT_37132 [Cercophora scortea]|uniref:Protein kinase domain-containing protein n=1 Tax=Cercophora scortea TaxID=314031 RepID=A0AAE0MLC7_9PEZI|nr:hypothetical protein B0T19DRAFT_37132 [Cercophora scortea]